MEKGSNNTETTFALFFIRDRYEYDFSNHWLDAISFVEEQCWIGRKAPLFPIEDKRMILNRFFSFCLERILASHWISTNDEDECQRMNLSTSCFRHGQTVIKCDLLTARFYVSPTRVFLETENYSVSKLIKCHTSAVQRASQVFWTCR